MDDQSPKKNPTGKEPEPGRASPAPDKDLSSEIEKAVEREPLDQVRCVRVFDNYYRCNWWSRLGGAHSGRDYDWAGLIMDSIRKSRFLTASIQAGQLVIEEVASTPNK